MSSNAVISVEGLSKAYQIYARPEDRLKQIIVGKKRKFYKEFYALKDINFEVLAGETVGFLGQNGAGKSTLLQLVCGTLAPTLGSVKIRGRVSALLELGVGFNPEFTGRDNVYLYATVLGLSRSEIDAKLDEILAFADIGDFVDLPVKTYSSGMLVRLAFAVAINVDPKVLIVDEALAVGDARFAARCMTKLNALRSSGVTVLFVSHDTEAIRRLCTRAYVLDKGKIVAGGPPVDIVNWYQAFVACDYNLDKTPKFTPIEHAQETDLAAENMSVNIEILNETQPTPLKPVEQIPEDNANNANEDEATEDEATEDEATGPETIAGAREDIDTIATEVVDELSENIDAKLFRYGDGNAQILKCQILNAHNKKIDSVKVGEEISLVFDVQFNEDCSEYGFGFYIDDRLGTHIIGINTFQEKVKEVPVKAGSILQFVFKMPLHIKTGAYTISPSIAYNQTETRWMDYIENALVFQIVDPEPNRIIFGSYFPPYRQISIKKITPKTIQR